VVLRRGVVQHVEQREQHGGLAWHSIA
jgi:hypothetical protein